MELNKSLLKVITKWAKKTETEMKKILSKNKKGSSRIYKQLKLVVKEKDSQITISSNLPSYSIFVDKGRKPGKQPPLKSIEAWCKSKNIDKSAAYPIARKIGKTGIKPTNFMDPFRKFETLIKELKLETVNFIKEEIKNK